MNVPSLETIKIDYESKGVAFYYIYKPLSHPEFNNYISPFNLEERLMHITEAKRRLGSSITWLADTMDNIYHDSVGKSANSELVVDANNKVVARRAWSNPGLLRADLVRLAGAVDEPTKVSELDLPTQLPITTVAKGIVPRVVMPAGAMPMVIEPILNSSRLPFYTKLRAEGTPELYRTGKGSMYIGFHLDPLYHVHWNNDAPPLELKVTGEGIKVTPAQATGPDPEESADADPREFILEVDAGKPGQSLDLSVKYYACDDALTFCVPVRQDYKLQLSLNESNHWSMPTMPDGFLDNSRSPNGAPLTTDFDFRTGQDRR
jgi:hypothetical protein